MNKAHYQKEVYFDGEIVAQSNVYEQPFEDDKLQGEMDANVKPTKYYDG